MRRLYLPASSDYFSRLINTAGSRIDAQIVIQRFAPVTFRIILVVSAPCLILLSDNRKRLVLAYIVMLADTSASEIIRRMHENIKCAVLLLST